jgi:asparagine synthase (glutamine-hydrolysing)
MCGFAGVVSRKRLSEPDRVAVRRMTDAMEHRGPDGFGFFDSTATSPSATGGVYMAMRRLSIIDLEHGWQPHHNEDHKVTSIANGEIYNYVELRAELLNKGHQFRTQNDCEVLVHLYEEFGLDFVQKLQGMFAFAVWDAHKRCLVLGRDRMGEKPLYVHIADEQVWFASELKSLLVSGKIPLNLDPTAVHAYLHYGWIPESMSIVQSVKKIQPGHLLTVHTDPWFLSDLSYWRLEDAPVVPSDDPVELVRTELDKVGERIVRSDVPIGVSLSGGLDSSIVAALAARHSRAPVKAFTVGYVGKPPQDERDDAIETARALGIEHHVIEIDAADMVRDFPRVAFLRDEPINDISGYGYFKVSEAARQNGCPVLLQGQGADELMWGYPWTVEAVRLTSTLRSGGKMGLLDTVRKQIPKRFSRPEFVRFAYFLGGMMHGWRTLRFALPNSVAGLIAYELTDSYQIGRQGASTTYTPAFKRSVALHRSIHHDTSDVLASINPESRLDIQMIATLCRGYLVQNGLAQGDRLSMANSVELRLPLVDYRLVELLVGLQKHKSMYNRQPKHVLREAVRGLVPECVFGRPKRPFSPPSTLWLESLRRAYAADLINGELVRIGILQSHAARKLAESQSRFGTGNDLFLKYLVLEFWYRGMRDVVAKAA